MAYTFLQKKNNSKSTLNGGITDIATSLVVTSEATFPASASFMCTIWDKTTYPDPSDDPNMEVVKVTGLAGATFTVTRAQEGTTGVAHSSGHAIELNVTAAQIVELETMINNNNPYIDQVLYFGNASTNGSWRFIISGGELSVQLREAGTWNEKGSFVA